ncbi:low molecular weight protein-tyrosine-phosphatase [Marinobacter bohaiensis]|uniref:low molecular weight protein-tyrosine-phosphatase n=1 Tax=Marinobacter bohaiensis TaxID=2201898 RepID=UPI000DADD64F|nr:low molecular weight protein-tyrosine-phosphatase [Marinobacter bohaiensis]
MPDPVRVLFVCMGNICRSPTAHGVFQARVEQAGLADSIEIDSCGTGAWHIGEPPDERAMAAARKRGYDLSTIRARQLKSADLDHFDYVLVMDRDNLARSRSLASSRRTQPELFLTYAGDSPVDEVPDPYYGGGDGFEFVLDLVESACDGLIDHIREHRL